MFRGSKLTYVKERDGTRRHNRSRADNIGGLGKQGVVSLQNRRRFKHTTSLKERLSPESWAVSLGSGAPAARI